MRNSLAALILAALLVACGGGDHAPAERFILVMETRAHASEFVYVYDTEADCVAAGSYRVFAFPDRYIGYACKDV